MLDKMIAVNVRGVFLSMTYELKQMIAQGFGSVINMSSGAGLVGVAGFSGYTAPKAAEIADAAVWLCSDKAGFITGVALPIDGGSTVP